MSILSPDLVQSRAVRLSLARGAAKDACRRAQQQEADIAGTFQVLRGLPPNRKAAERLVARLRHAPGVVLAGVATEHKARVLMVLRTAPEALYLGLAEEDFTEASIIYTRIETVVTKGAGLHFLHRVTVSPHALQRLVERSACPIGPGLLATVDAEVRPMFRALRMGAAEVGQEIHVRSDGCQGLWVGRVSETPAEEHWGLQKKANGVLTLAIRTFLDEAHMSPANYLRWKGDPTLTVQ